MVVGWIYCVAGILFCLSGAYIFLKTVYEKGKKLIASFLLMIMGVILIGIGTAKYFNLLP
jgi:hypothetical protein